MDPRKPTIHLLRMLVFLAACLGALSTFAISSDWEKQAKEALEKGQLDAARSQAEGAGVMMQLARGRFLSGEDDRAVELLETMAHGNSAPDLLLEIGKLLFERVYYKQAISPLTKVWEQKRGSYDAGMYLALSHYLLHQFSESRGVLKEIQAGSASRLDYQILLGCVAARLGQWEEAEKELEKAIRQAPGQADGYLNLGLFYLERGDTERSMKMIEKGSTLMAKGTKLLYSIPPREHCMGLEPPQSLKNQDKVRGEFYCKLARVLQDTEQRGSAFEVYQLALELDNGAAAAYAGIGRLCFDRDSFDVARSFLQRGLELNPRAAELHFNLGLIYQYQSQFEEAIRSYQKAIELGEPNVPALYWVQIGTAQLGGSKPNEVEAEASFMKALKHNPNFAQAHYQLGKLFFQRKEFDRSEQSLELAIRLDPKLVRAYYQYGQACLRNGKSEKGRMLLETFNRKRALRESSSSGVGMGGDSPASAKVLP